MLCSRLPTVLSSLVVRGFRAATGHRAAMATLGAGECNCLPAPVSIKPADLKK